jgi:uroporphyrinogen-III synthase
LAPTKFSVASVTPSAPGRVLITRSQPGAAKLAEALVQAGFESIQYPVLEIRVLDPAIPRQTLAQLDRFDLVIFVSVHAVEVGIALIDETRRQRPRDLTWIAIGAATAAALARHGVDGVVPDDESSEGILALPETRAISGVRVLIVAGRGGRTELGTGLAQRGASVERIELYERSAVAPGGTPIPHDGVGVVVVSSADGARAFAALWRSVRGDFDVPVIAPSLRVANVLRDLAFTTVVESAGANALAVIEAVRTSLERQSE